MNYNPDYIEHLRKGRETQKRIKQQQINDFNKNPKECIKCNKPLQYKQRRNEYCSRSCAAIINNLSKGQEIKCLKCGKKLRRRFSKQKYCSHHCSARAKADKSFERLDCLEDLSGFSSTTIRRYVLKRHINQCSICKNTKWREENIPLVVDHIDGNPYNNKKTNLRLICPNCDAQLPTYKGRNKGNGRHSRRQRYKDGKSY